MKYLKYLSLVLGFSLPVYAAFDTRCLPNLSHQKLEILERHDLEKDEQIWKIYHESFPKEESWTKEVILDRNYSKNDGMMIRVSENSNTLGFIEMIFLTDIPMTYIGYIAVDKKYQNLGLGKQLFKCADQESVLIRKEKGQTSLGLVWEIERKPGLLSLDPVYSFYKKLGGILLLEDYFQPPLRPGENFIDMALMYLPSSQDQISPEQVRAILYHEIYPEYWEAGGKSVYSKFYRKFD